MVYLSKLSFSIVMIRVKSVIDSSSGSTLVATDAPRSDQDWLDRLSSAADKKQQFTIYPFKVLTHGFSADQHRHLAYLLKRAPIPHRAAPDALRPATKLMEAHLGYLS